jgi:uncharacterized protein YwqG
MIKGSDPMDKAFSRWQEVFEQVREIEGLDSQALFEQAEPCFYQKWYQAGEEVTEDKPDLAQIGGSRIGGLPDLPETLSWPIYDGQAMAFLAQVNCSELESNFVPNLPDRGWLYFFASEPNIWHGIPHRVLYFDGLIDDLQQTSLPGDAKTPFAIFSSYQYRFETGFSLYSTVFDETFGKRHMDGLIDDNMFGKVIDLFQAERDRIGGFPMSFHPFSEFFAYLALNGLDLMCKYGTSEQYLEYQIERKKMEETDPEHARFLRTEVLSQIREYTKDGDYHKERMKDLRTLLVLGSDGDEMMWGDLGFLQFFIFKEDLEKRDFSRTRCDLIST